MRQDIQNISNVMEHKNESVVQRVINKITEDIINKELKPGDKLPPEPELAGQLGVARSSVREAIKILSYLGVLESKRAEGTHVCSGFKESMIDPMIYGIILNQDESMEDLMELREITEAGILRLAMKKYDEERAKGLLEILDRMKEIISKGQSEEVADEFFVVDNEFHDMISKLGNNPMADKISRVVRSLTYALRYDTVRIMILTGRSEELYQAHADICEMLKSGNTSNVNEVVSGTYFKEVFE